MKTKVGGVMCLVAVFAGCGADAEGGDGYDEPGAEAATVPEADGEGTTGSALAACPSFNATLDQHVAAGRAYITSVPFFIFTFKIYYAKGSSQQLGNEGNLKVTLYPTAHGNFTSDASQCSVCGNGVVESGVEVCDGADAAGKTCASFGFLGGGTLGCNSYCTQTDTSQCRTACGNRTIEPSEFCDGNDPALACADFHASDYVSGNVKCGSDCQADVSACKRSVCGNGKQEVGELCDGADLGPIPSCTQQGGYNHTYGGGQLRCTSTCEYDVSGCTEACGDGVLQASEYCDGNLWGPLYGGKSCKDVPYPDAAWPFNNTVNYASGELKCSSCGVSFADCRPLPGCYNVSSGGLFPTYTLKCF